MHLFFINCLSPFFLIYLVCSVSGLKEKEDVQYKVDIIDKPVKKEIRKQAEFDATYYEMTSAEGQKYDCYIPNPPNSETGTNPAMIPTPLEIDNVLKELSNSCILRLSGWFTYEYCYHKHMSQFHQPAKEAPVEQMYYLGVYSTSSPQGEIKNLNLERVPSSDGTTLTDLPYYSEMYSDGTPCEIMPFLPRTTEIRYYCGTDKVNVIKEIHEPSSCTYIVEILTNHMCTFSVFKPKFNPILNVMCFPNEGSFL
eukprot:Phypoly_transcript_16814.p1 GENE.Phypoly_transcript_16814~~Phypoly_transcript_16814.p1  ORF type:complete len:253 (+),score=20.44 Phypoly_transcript_16814:77-835(+)